MEYDEIDEFICRKLYYVINSVKTYYKFRIFDLGAKREVGILTENEYEKQLRKDDYLEDVKKYFNSLCTDELKKIELTSNIISFETIFSFDTRLFLEMDKKKSFKELVPYFTENLISKQRYNEIKQNLKDMIEQNNQTEETEENELEN